MVTAFSSYFSQNSQDRIALVAEHLERNAFTLLEAQIPTEVSCWWERLEILRSEISEGVASPIAMVGATGAGKSTLVNALLGREILPVRSMKPYSAVVTTVRHSDEDGYRTTVGFLTRDEWEQELRVSGDHVNVEVGDEEQVEVATWEDLKRVTRDKLKAVYGLVEVDAHSRLDVASLPLPDEIAALLDSDSEPVTITGSDPKEFAKKLKRYLADAELVWVVFNTKRGVTADVWNLLLEQKLLRQLLLDGRTDALTLMGTHADDVSGVTPEQLGMDPDEDFEVLDIIRERNRQVVAQVRADVDDIAEELARAASEDGAGLRKLRGPLHATAILPVLTRAYVKIHKIGRVIVDFGVPEAGDTGMPELLAHLDEICRERSPQANVAAEIDRIEGMLAEIAHLRERGAAAA